MDILFRPNRLEYVKHAMGKKDECVFCKQKQLGVTPKSLLLYLDELTMVILNKYPYNSGHMLVLPTRHESNLLNLDDREYSALNKTIKNTISIIQNNLKPDALNMGINMGTEAGAGLPDHLHYHVVPRWRGDTNFFPVISNSKVLPTNLEDLSLKLQPKFKEIK